MSETQSIDVDKFNCRTSDCFVVKKITDDSGDYTQHSYSILAKMQWGDRTICEDIENPHDAMMFASAPQMIEEILSLRSKVAGLEMILERAKNSLVEGQ